MKATVSAFTAFQRGDDIADDVGVVTTAEDLTDDFGAVGALIDDQIDVVDGALGVASAEELVDQTSIDGGMGRAVDVGRRHIRMWCKKGHSQRDRVARCARQDNYSGT